MRLFDSEYHFSEDSIREDVLHRGSRLMLAIAVGSFFIALVIALWLTVVPADLKTLYGSGLYLTDTDNDQQHSRPLVGVVVGHAGFDPGAVCPDGLTEVEINTQVAEGVISRLNKRGVKTDLLAEFDPKLTNYQANALVSIHADSCSVPGVSGFKAARVTLSAIPEAEDRLVSCLINEYGKITGLPEHPASITDGMTDYHAFREIAPTTPGAIIETGFMLDDRDLLENNPDLVARGIVSGIICFLNTAENDG